MLPVLIGGGIGILGGLIPPICLEYFKLRAERKSITGAIVSEIASLVNIIERRQYIEGLRRVLVQAKVDASPNSRAGFTFSVRRNPFSVYDANLTRLGLLRDPLPRNIVRFYSRASAILEDIADMKEATIVRSREDSIYTLETLLALFEDTHALGKQIVAGAS